MTDNPNQMRDYIDNCHVRFKLIRARVSSFLELMPGVDVETRKTMTTIRDLASELADMDKGDEHDSDAEDD